MIKKKITISPKIGDEFGKSWFRDGMKGTKGRMDRWLWKQV